VSHQVRDLLLEQMDRAWLILLHRLEGLSEHEYFWPPVRDCWTVRQDQRGRWITDYAGPAPDPPAFATIAWRPAHLSACKIMYHEYAFASGTLTCDDIPAPATAAAATAGLETGQARLRQSLSALQDSELAKRRATNWGDRWPTWRIFWTMIFHDAHHGAETACLCDPYRAIHE
jgi:hypothetical protein